MEQKSHENENTQAIPNTSTTENEKTLSQKFKEMPYDESRLGQAFIMSWTPPKNATTPSSSGKETDEPGEAAE